MSSIDLSPLRHKVPPPPDSAASPVHTDSSWTADMAAHSLSSSEDEQDKLWREFINFNADALGLNSTSADGEELFGGAVTDTLERMPAREDGLLTNEADDSASLFHLTIDCTAQNAGSPTSNLQHEPPSQRSNDHGTATFDKSQHPQAGGDLSTSSMPGHEYVMPFPHQSLNQHQPLNPHQLLHQNERSSNASTQSPSTSKLSDFTTLVAYFGKSNFLAIPGEHPFVATEIFLLSSICSIAWASFSDDTKWQFVERWTNHIQSGCTCQAEKETLELALTRLAQAHGVTPYDYLNRTQQFIHPAPSEARAVVGHLIHTLIQSVPHERHMWHVPLYLQDSIVMMMQDMAASPEIVAEAICLALVIDASLPLDVAPGSAWSDFITDLKDELRQDGLMNAKSSAAQQVHPAISTPSFSKPNNKRITAKQSDHTNVTLPNPPDKGLAVTPRPHSALDASIATLVPGIRSAPLLSASVTPFAVTEPPSTAASTTRGTVANNSHLITNAGPVVASNALPPAQTGPTSQPLPIPPTLPTVSGLGPMPDLYAGSLDAGMAAYSNPSPQGRALHPSHATPHGLASVATAEGNWQAHRDILYAAVLAPPANPSAGQLSALRQLEAFITIVNDPNRTKAGDHGPNYDPRRADEFILATVYAILRTAFYTHRYGFSGRDDQLNFVYKKSKERADRDRALSIDARLAHIEYALRQEKRLVVECVDSLLKIKLLVCGPLSVIDGKTTFSKSNERAAAVRNGDSPVFNKRGPRTPRP